jgi:hypothetical protein
MTRPYSNKFLLELNVASEEKLGVSLGMVCVKANLPATYISKMLGCSRMTVHSWFRGGGVREDKRKRIEALIDLIKKDMDAGKLPAQSVVAAKKYIQEAIGESV